ncbi:MAG TPA: MarR family transcriptional regulator [Solirubrobacteraceae bacterium]|jgi:DNA-binding MarR family transcriptional regulator
MASLQDTLFQELARAGSEARRAFSLSTGTSERRRQLLPLLLEHGEVSHDALKRRLCVDGATVTRLVKQLESEAAVSRRLDPTDNRFTLVSLTESGKEMAAELHDERRQFQRRLLAGVNREEQKTVIRVLEQVRRNVEAIARPEDQSAAKPDSAELPRSRKR